MVVDPAPFGGNGLVQKFVQLPLCVELESSIATLNVWPLDGLMPTSVSPSIV